MGPHQITEFADLLLGIELGAQVHEMQEGPQAEAHDKMLAVVKRQDAAGVLLGEAGGQHFAIALRRRAAQGQILGPLLGRVIVFFALAIAIAPHRPQVKHLFELQFPIGGPGDALARIAHRLHIKTHPNPVGAGLLHHRVGKPAHIEGDLGVLQGAVVAAFAGQQAFDTDLTGLGLLGPLPAI